MDLRPALLAVLLLATQPVAYASTPLHTAPAPMLASRVSGNIDVASYLVSEKLDGVRARWDGRALWTRSGNRIDVPETLHPRLAGAADGWRTLARPRTFPGDQRPGPRAATQRPGVATGALHGLRPARRRRATSPSAPCACRHWWRAPDRSTSSTSRSATSPAAHCSMPGWKR